MANQEHVLDYVVVLVHLNILSKNVEPQPFYKNMLSNFLLIFIQNLLVEMCWWKNGIKL
jgi:hypothetical protein